MNKNDEAKEQAPAKVGGEASTKGGSGDDVPDWLRDLVGPQAGPPSLPTSLQVKVPQQFVGKALLGRRGYLLKEIQSKTGTRITVEDHDANFSIATITGPDPTAYEKAQALIQENIDWAMKAQKDKDDWREEECLKFLESSASHNSKLKSAEDLAAEEAAAAARAAAAKAASPYGMRDKPICWDIFSGSVWTGAPTAIVGDSMMRGKEMKNAFKSWARLLVYEDQESLAQKPPFECDRVFYVSAGNALYRHPVLFQDSAFKNIRSDDFLQKVGGVLLLGSVELWDRLYAPTQHSGKTINPTFFKEVTELLKEHDVPVMQLDDDFITNLQYTDDVHPAAGKAQADLAQYIQTHLVELSQRGAKEIQLKAPPKPVESKRDTGGDTGWQNEYSKANAKEDSGNADSKWSKGSGWKDKSSGGHGGWQSGGWSKWKS